MHNASSLIVKIFVFGLIVPGYLASSHVSRDILYCAPPWPPGSSSNSVSLNNTRGLNYIILYACNAPQPSNETCAPGSSTSVFSCGLILSPNATSFVNITLATGTLTAVTVQYHSSNPFSYHAIKSTPPLSILWPPPGDRGFVDVPYPSPDSILCDVDDDCPRGVKCNTLLQYQVQAKAHVLVHVTLLQSIGCRVILAY